jgi:VWFA-related protein
MLAALVAAPVLLDCGPAAEGGQPSFSARVEAVRVDVLVTENGQPVLGLGAADFEVFDNGVAQKVELVSFDEIPLNVVLALDMSGSVDGERLDNLKSAGLSLVGALERGDHVGLVTLSHVVTLGSGLTDDVSAVRATLNRAGGQGETALIDGAYAAMALGESDAGRALLIVFSDGLDTASWLPAAVVLDIAKRSDVVVYAVATQSRVKPEFLRELTSLTGGRLYEVEKTANLASIFVRVLQEFRQRYLVSYTPKGVDQPGWHRLEVRVKGRRKPAIQARPGYLSGS